MRVLGSSCALVTLAAFAHADVWKVGPGQPFPAVQAAIDVAADGDLILVTGPPAVDAPAVVDGVSLTIARESASVFVLYAPLTVRNLAAGQAVVLRDLWIWSAESSPGLVVAGNQGSVRVSGCDLRGGVGTLQHFDGYEGVYVTQSVDVAFAETTVVGGLGLGGDFIGPGPGGPGLFVRSSNVVVADGDVEGGRGGIECFDPDPPECDCGNGGAGGNALESPDGFVYASGGAVTGGHGQDWTYQALFCGFPSGGFGGDGLVLTTQAATAIFQDVALAGGPAGVDDIPFTSDGVPSDIQDGATFQTIPDPARSLSVSGLVRELEPLIVTVAGQPGDQVFLYLSESADFVYPTPFFEGVQLFGLPAIRRFLVGTIGPSGALTVPLVTPALPVADENRTWFLQGVVRDLGGTVWLTGSQPWIQLDQAL